MRKIDLPLICDVLFYGACAFFLSVGILRFYRVPMAISLLCAVLFALAAGGIAFLILYSKRKKYALSKAERARKEGLMLHLALEQKGRVLEALQRAYAADGRQTEIGDGCLTEGEKRWVVLFTMQPVSADAVAEMLRSYGGSAFGLLCNELTPEAEKLMRSFGKDAVTGDEVFALFERTGTTPSPLICGDLPRPKLRARLKRSFSKRNAKPFFVSGMLLLVMSLFTFFPLYYLISGSILLLTAVAVRAFGYA